MLNIKSNRKYESWASWHVVHEWEDILSDKLTIPIVDLKEEGLLAKINNQLKNKVNGYRQLRSYFTDKRLSNTCSLVFHLKVQHFVPQNHIPVIVDFWKNQDLNRFYKAYQKCPLVLISSREVFDFLKGKKCPLNIAHWGLSLPDYYFTTADYSNKTIDILQAGRQNEMLSSYVERLISEDPSIHYVYKKGENGRLHYISSIDGDLGALDSREAYMKLLQKSKIALYSSPGLDGGENRTGGFNQITPRFLEYLASGCSVIGRYKMNSDADYYEMPKFCTNIESAEQFTLRVKQLLDKKPSKDERAINHSYLQQHITSKRAESLKQLLLENNLI